MMKQTRQHATRFGTLSLAALFVAVAMSQASSAAELNAREKAAQDREANIKKMLHRQTTDDLRVYTNGRTYVNGTQLGLVVLQEVVERAGLDAATLTHEPYIAPYKVDEIKQAIVAGGIDNITVVEKKSNPKQQQEDTIRLLIARQKTGLVNVYMNDRGTYINGRSVSGDLMKKLLPQLDVDQALITAESYVSDERLNAVKATIEASGIQKVDVTRRPAD